MFCITFAIRLPIPSFLRLRIPFSALAPGSRGNLRLRQVKPPMYRAAFDPNRKVQNSTFSQKKAKGAMCECGMHGWRKCSRLRHCKKRFRYQHVPCFW